MKNKTTLLIGSVLIIIITLPYLVADLSVGSAYQFRGFLLNPSDGNSYLAKMRQGFEGEWLFTLPFSSETGKGAFLFEFYLLLGHISRVLGLPLIVVYHACRIISAIGFLFILSEFLRKKVKANGTVQTHAAILVCFGSGLGWILALFQIRTGDFWITEAYPFLSALSTPHFILGMAIFLFLLLRTDIRTMADFLLFWAGGLLLSIVMPFAGVNLGVILVAREIWRWLEERKIQIRPAIGLMLGGGICTVFQFWQTQNDPLLQSWNAQNVTLTLPIWDIIVSFSPVLLFAIPCAVLLVKNRPIDEGHKLLLIWAAGTLLLCFAPFQFQRRFLFAFFIPLAILAAEGINSWQTRFDLRKNTLFNGVLAVSIITNTFLVTGSILMAKNNEPFLVISHDEQAAFTWVEENTGEEDIVLASPQLGLFLPADTGRRVIYGHPFETTNAEKNLMEVLDFFSNQSSEFQQQAFLDEREIAWIVMGPREKTLGGPAIIKNLNAVYENASVTIYQVEKAR
jgi:hypothetical protein